MVLGRVGERLEAHEAGMSANWPNYTGTQVDSFFQKLSMKPPWGLAPAPLVQR